MPHSPSIATTWMPSAKLIDQWKDLVGPQTLLDRFTNFLSEKSAEERPTSDLTTAFYLAVRVYLRFRNAEAVMLTEEDQRRIVEDMCKDARTRKHPLEHRLAEVHVFARTVFDELGQELSVGGKFFCKDNPLMYPPESLPLWELLWENGHIVGVRLSQASNTQPSSGPGETAAPPG